MVYSLYFFEYLRYGEWASLIDSLGFVLTKKSNSNGGVIKSAMGVFNTRPNSLDFQYINYAYEYKIKQFVKNHSFDIFIDAGACVGEYSIWLAQKGKTCIAFEPIKSSYDLMNENILLNNVKDKVTLYNYGLGKEHSREFFFVNHLNFGASKKVDTPTDFNETHEVVSFDEILPSLHIDHNAAILFKIDVEGMEPELLEGARNFIKTHKNLTFIIEEKLSGKSYLKSVLSNLGNFKFGTIDEFNFYATKID